MTKYIFSLVKRASLSVLLLAGLLSMEACQLTTSATQKATVRALNTGVPGSPEKVVMPEKRSVEKAPVISARQAPRQSGVSVKHFVIPVARSGDFAPDELDEYVLNIIEESRQWDYVSEFQVHGHTDSEGSELSNMLLSIRRANRVAERFEELGVEAGLLLIEAHGETQAIADNTTLDGRIANRRIEIVLIGHAGKAADEQDKYDAVVAKLRSQGDKP